MLADIQHEAKTALKEHFLTTLTPLLRSGKLPMLDFTREDLDKQYDNVWKEPKPWRIMFGFS
jgi:hypothetical protein